MKKIDKFIYYNSIVLLIVPILIYWIFFTRTFIGIPMSFFTIYLSYRVFKNYKESKYMPNKKYWLIAVISIFLWLFFSGVGGFSFQNEDFHYRNALLRDLINYSWPVKYDNYGLVYYFTYFLPCALVGKITNFSIANIFLFIYSYISILSILYLINRYIGKDSTYSLILLIFFSGLDVLVAGKNALSFSHIEWYTNFFQYSANTTLLYWVFNQTIPIWLITILLLNLSNNKNILFISSLSFFYSPFATIMIVPISVYLYLKNTNNIIKNIVSLEFINALIILFVLGSFYLSGNGIGFFCFLLSTNNSKVILLLTYISFILIELGLYVIPTFKVYKNDKLYLIVIIILLSIPFCIMSINNDFISRTSIAPLFILMVYFIKYLESGKKRIIIYFLLLITFINPIHEIGRSVYFTFTTSDYITDDIISLGNPKIYKEKVKYEMYGSLNSFYYKYLSK